MPFFLVLKSAHKFPWIFCCDALLGATLLLFDAFSQTQINKPFLQRCKLSAPIIINCFIRCALLCLADDEVFDAV